MLIIFINTFLIILLFTPYGLLLSNKNKNTLEYFSIQLIYGSIILCFIALSLNFFFSLNKFLNTVILILPIIILIKERKIYFSKEFLLFLLISSIIISLLITESNVYRPDAGLYHLPYIKILNDEKIIFGLSNLHFRYAHISIIQYLSAISNNFIFQNNGIVFAQALIASAVIVNFSYKIYNYNINKNYSFHFFYLIAVLIYIFYKMNRYSEYGNDAPSHFLFFFLISEFLTLNKKNIKEICNIFILIMFIIFNKITLLMSVFIGLFLLKKINLNRILKLNRFYFLTFFSIFWILKNIFVSGCILYPVKSLCFQELIWSDIKTVESVSSENEAWTKGWPDYTKKKLDNNEQIISKKLYVKNFFWFTYWADGHLKKILDIIIPYIIVLIFLSYYLFIKKKISKRIRYEKLYVYLISLMFISCLFWLIKVPVFRYGYSYLISFLALSFAIICIQFTPLKKNITKSFNFLLLACFSILIIKNSLRIINNNNNYNNYPWPKYYAMDKKNDEHGVEEINLNIKKIYKPKGYCMFSNSPCAHYGLEKNVDLKIIKGDYIIFYIK